VNEEAARIAETEGGRQRGIRTAGAGTRQAELTAELMLEEKQVTLA